MKTKLMSLVVLTIAMGLGVAFTCQAAIRMEITSSRVPGPNFSGLTDYYQRGMQWKRFHAYGALGTFPAFSKTSESGDEIYYDILEWLDVALHSNGVDGRREAFWIKIWDDDGVTRHHPKEFRFAIRSSDSGSVINFFGNLGTNVANNQELVWSSTTFVGWNYGPGGVTNVFTSGAPLEPADVFITPLRVWLTSSNSADMTTIETFVLINDPWRITCEISDVAGTVTNTLVDSTAPIMLMSTVNTGTNTLPVATLVGQPSDLASYFIESMESPPSTQTNWVVIAGPVPDGWSEAFTDWGPKKFKAFRGYPPTSETVSQSKPELSARFSQTDD